MELSVAASLRLRALEMYVEDTGRLPSSSSDWSALEDVCRWVMYGQQPTETAPGITITATEGAVAN